MLKLYAWEESFITKITEIRNKELRHLTNSMYLGAAVSFTFICAPFLVRKCFSLFQFANTVVFNLQLHPSLSKNIVIRLHVRISLLGVSNSRDRLKPLPLGYVSLSYVLIPFLSYCLWGLLFIMTLSPICS